MRIFTCVLLALFATSSAFADSSYNKNLPLFKTMGSASISGISTALAGADVALCKSMIYPPHLRGDYGETIVGKFYLEQYLKRSGSWQSISARFGRQGIDQIYIKYDTLGRPRDIIVGEVKYGSSSIGTTKQDGIQIGRQWTEKRLVALGSRYLRAGSFEDIIIQERPSKLNVRHQIEIDLGNGRKGIFWREDGRSQWKYEGRQEDLPLAQKKARSIGQFLKKAGENVIRVRRRIFEVKTDNDFLTIKIKDAKYLDSGISQTKIRGKTMRIRLNSASGKLSNQALSEEIAKQLKRNLPYLSDNECRDYAQKIVDKRTNVEDIRIPSNSFAKTVFATSLKAGTAGAIFALAVEAISQGLNGRLDYQRLFGNAALGFGAVGAGTAVGQITTAAIIKSRIAHAALTETASSLGISSSFLGNAVGSSVGAGVSFIIFAYGGYLLGYYDSYTANKIAISGLIGAGGGTAAASGTMALVSSYAVAGTGTEISSLSGAAATNASLAWLGGGPIASGGGGVAAGTVALASVVTVTVIAVSAATMYCFHLYEQKEENKMLNLLLADYKKGDVFKYQAERLFRLSRTNPIY